MDQASSRGPSRDASGRFGPGAPGRPRGAPDETELAALPQEDVVRITRAVRAALERVEAGEGSLADIEGALTGPGPDEGAP
jgi:hypothetical protein